jgi:uncharacterized membrane protein (UPF0127 family)
MRLMRDEQILVPHLEEARSLWTRARGLLGRRDLAHDQGMLFRRCNSVHTFFMRFTLDLVFLDKRMTVVKTLKNVRPGRITWPVWRASSVIEFGEGFLDKHPIRVGDRLHVDSTLS